LKWQLCVKNGFSLILLTSVKKGKITQRTKQLMLFLLCPVATLF